MTTERDDATLRRYREANEALDERPSAAARAAILAAAARHVEAKPQSADGPRAMRRRRWPLAAAAAVLLSTLAVMLAQRTEQEMPTFNAPPAKSQEEATVSMRPAPASSKGDREPQGTPNAPAATRPDFAAESSVNAAQRADGHPSAPGQPPRLKQTAPAPAGNEHAPAPSATPEARNAAPAIAPDETKRGPSVARESEAASAEARNAFPAAPAAAPVPPAVARPAPTPPAQDALGTASGAADSAKSDAATLNRSRREAAPSAVPRAAARQDVARDFERSAQEWLDYIVKLRGEGRHVEADAEVKRFRDRYPETPVPASALAPAAAGTR